MKPKDYLLDTNIWIGYVKHDSALFDRVDDALASGRTYMSLITEGKLIFGAFKSQNWEQNLARISGLLQQTKIIYLNDRDIAFTYGLVKSNLKEQGITLAENDLWIASTAIRHRLTLVTRDRDFDRIKGFQLNIEAW